MWFSSVCLSTSQAQVISVNVLLYMVNLPYKVEARLRFRKSKRLGFILKISSLSRIAKMNGKFTSYFSKDNWVYTGNFVDLEGL